MKKGIIIAIILLTGISFSGFPQTTDGEIMGRVWNSDSTETIVGANVWVEINGEKRGVVTDINGKFRMSSVPTGVYTLKASFVGEELSLSGIEVAANEITRLGELKMGNTMLGPVDIIWTKPILKEDELSKIDISYDEIQVSAVRSSPLQLAATAGGTQLTADGNGLIIRGSRPESTIYYIDGVKQQSMATVPSAAIGSMSVYTGGLPAKYGDCVGGVVVVETVSYFDLYNRWKSRQLK